MLRIIVSKSTVRLMEGVSAKTGKPYSLRFQEAYIYTQDADGNVDQFPTKFEISLDKDQVAYPVGEYQLHPSSIYMSREGKLSVSPRLAPAKAPAPARATA